MKRKITLKQIARELEVSISTVSKALKDSHEISRETKQKIQAFAKLYNYKPNHIAISLKSSRTHRIAVMIPDIFNHFFASIFCGIEDYAKSKGYHVILCLFDESLDSQKQMEILANRSVDGFIVSLSFEKQLNDDYKHFIELTAQSTPLVLLGRMTNTVKCDKVILNEEKGVYKSVKKLINNGRRKIAFITAIDNLGIGKAREEGYFQALLDAHMKVDENLILRLPDVNSSEEKQMNHFFASKKVDAVLCLNEIYAIHAMKIVQKMGFKVPEDISFIVLADGILAKFSNPTLTAIDQHGERMGKIAAKMVLEQIESEKDDETYRTEILEATIIERESTQN